MQIPMLDQTQSITNSSIEQTSLGESETNTAAASDFEDFLQLLTAQLRNQDPLEPLDSTQFVEQLASFSTVEQLVNANAKLDTMAASLGGINDLHQYTDLIGKTIETKDGSSYFDGQQLKFRIGNDANADQVEIVIEDVNGNELDRFAGANDNSLQVWTGSVDGAILAKGAYTVRVEYFKGGEVIGSKAANGFSTVQEIKLKDGVTVLGLEGGGTAELASIVSVS